ncbi:hypothetical protein [Streptomyces sp. NPDC000878]
MSWQNGTHGADGETYGANEPVGAVGAYDGQGARPESAGPPQEPNVYHPQADPGPAPAYDAYTDPAAAHGWQNAYDATAELPVTSAPPGTGAGSGGGRRRKEGASGRRGLLVGAVVGGVGVVSVAALVVGFVGSDASTGDGEDGVRPSAGASVSSAKGPGEPSATPFSDPVTTGPSEGPSAARAVGSASGGTASAGPSGAATAASASPTATATATEDSGPGNSGSNPGRGQGATKKPK